MQGGPITADGVPLSRGATALVVLYLVSWFWQPAAFEVLSASGFYRWYYGADATALAHPRPEEEAEQRLGLGAAAGGAGVEAAAALRRAALLHMQLWALFLAFPFQVATFPIAFSRLSGIPPAELGLTERRLGRNVLAGALAALLLTPVVIWVNEWVVWFFRRSGPGAVQEHPLMILAGEGLRPAEWVLLAAAPVVVAAVVEELLFRGMLQGLFARRRWGGHAAMAASLLVAVVYRREQTVAAWWGRGDLVVAAAPALFVLGLVPVYLFVWWQARGPAAPAVFGTSLLFACVHTSVWPSPVALFVLALGLGALAQRTGSLVGPIVLHGLFNGVSCALLLRQALGAAG